MRDPARLLPLYSYLAKIHEEHFPDLRIGQFLKNVSDWYGADIFYIEDDRLYELIPRYLKSLELHEKFAQGARK